MGCDSYAVETTCKLNVHKMLRRCPGRLLNGRLLNNLRPLSNVQLKCTAVFSKVQELVYTLQTNKKGYLDSTIFEQKGQY